MHRQHGNDGRRAALRWRKAVCMRLRACCTVLAFVISASMVCAQPPRFELQYMLAQADGSAPEECEIVCCTIAELQGAAQRVGALDTVGNAVVVVLDMGAAVAMPTPSQVRHIVDALHSRFGGFRLCPELLDNATAKLRLAVLDGHVNDALRGDAASDGKTFDDGIVGANVTHPVGVALPAFGIGGPFGLWSGYVPSWPPPHMPPSPTIVPSSFPHLSMPAQAVAAVAAAAEPAASAPGASGGATRKRKSSR